MIKKIFLNNFRCHKSLELDFASNFVYITGPNGSGKTSILEAIYYISTSKSHRTNNDLEAINKNSKEFALIKLNTSEKNYSLVISEKGKVATVNNKEVHKFSEFIGDLKVVLFSPEDLNLIKGTPSNRRNFIDIELMKVNKRYLSSLSTYKKILKQRNALLKNLNPKSDLTFLNILGLQLYDVGIKIINMRKEFLEDLNYFMSKIYKKFSNNDTNLIYEPNVVDHEFLNHIENNQLNDILYKTTMVGPHRDDFSIIFNNFNAKQSSQGETRLIVIALKLGLVKLIEKRFNTNVILLLDDVLSELDINIQNIFLNEIPKDIQIIMNSAIPINNKDIQIIKLKGDNVI